MSLEARLFLLFSLLLFAASLRSPMITALPSGSTVWRVIAATGGIRYWFFPTLAFAWTLVTLALEPKGRTAGRMVAVALLPVMLIGVLRDWRHPAFTDLHFAVYAETLSKSAPGTVLVFLESTGMADDAGETLTS